MTEIGLLIGLYSYLIFSLGILGGLYNNNVLIITLGFWLFVLVSFWSRLKFFFKKINLLEVFKTKTCLILLFLILLQVFVNLIGALGPELGFDALWYHLTLPKIYLNLHRIVFIPGNLLYYSAMPKLVEMLFLASLSIKGEILARFISFLFGLMSVFVLIRLSRRYLSVQGSLLAGVIFYSSLVVGWQSITAYVDLGRTFWEILALDYFLRWWEEKKKSDLTEAAVFTGLAISTKLLSLGTMIIFLLLICLRLYPGLKNILSEFFRFSFFSLLIPLPWFVFSFVQTKNPVYPLWGGILDSNHHFTPFNLINFFRDFWLLMTRSADPISPVFLIALPLLLFYWKKIKKKSLPIFLYCFFAYSVWFFIPRLGGGRFFLPYLPVFSLACVSVYEAVVEDSSGKKIKKIFLSFVILFAIVNLFYRGIANLRFLPLIFGKEEKSVFLAKNLNFDYGDFYDVDGFFQQNILKEDRVLIYGVHNLFYVDFPFVHESWAKTGMPITHILTQNSSLPEKFGKRKLLYQNNKTKVKLYLYGEKLK